MFCQNCGATVEANAQSCPACGHPLRAAEIPFAPPSPPIPPYATPLAPPANNGLIQTGKWISEAWEIVKTDLPMFALTAFIVAAVSSAVPVVLQGTMAIGFHIAIIKKIRTGKLDVADVFKGFDFLVPSLVAALLIGIFTFFGTLACIVPGLIVHAMYQFTYLFILDKRLDFWPAMEASFALVKRDMMGFTLFALALLGLNIAGALLCIVGLFVTAPISAVAITMAYRDLVGLNPQTAAV